MAAGRRQDGDRLKGFLMKHPVARELLAEAEYDEGDMHWRRNLAYFSTTFSGDGFVLVGDAAAFMDPFYSPGMDWISFTTSAAADLITAQRRGEPMDERINKHNRDFAQSHRGWFETLYKDKYEYMGEWDLMSLAFRLDLGLYYFGVVSQPFKYGEQALTQPPFSKPISRPFRSLMRTYNRRFAQIARLRRSEQRLGRTNRGRRCLLPGYTMKPSDLWLVVRALVDWGWLELTEGCRSWFARPASSDTDASIPAAKVAPQTQTAPPFSS
jgi:hypothetical protein